MKEFAWLKWSVMTPQLMMWTSLLLGLVPTLSAQTAQSCCEVLELRQYTLYPGKRDVLIDLFEREFIESQEALGAQVIGQFRDLDNPDRFVWLRGFRDMDARLDALQSFYDGPVWKAHREEANATMADSSNVLLLRRVDADSSFPSNQNSRPAVGAGQESSSLVVATIYYLKAPADDAFRAFFEQQVIPVMTKAGARPLAYFETETLENNYPRLPVRTGENVFVWFSSFANGEAFSEHLQRLKKTKNWSESINPELSSHFKSAPEHLRLEPTPRSLLR